MRYFLGTEKTDGWVERKEILHKEKSKRPFKIVTQSKSVRVRKLSPFVRGKENHNSCSQTFHDKLLNRLSSQVLHENKIQLASRPNRRFFFH